MSKRVCNAQTSSASQEQGFTLLEVLVALTILSLSVTVLFGIFSAGLDRTRQDTRAMQARVLAQSLLAEAQSAPPRTNADGEAESGAMWHLQVSPLARADAIATGLAAQKVSATVHWRSGDRDQSLTLTTLVFAPRESR